MNEIERRCSLHTTLSASSRDLHANTVTRAVVCILGDPV